MVTKVRQRRIINTVHLGHLFNGVPNRSTFSAVTPFSESVTYSPETRGDYKGLIAAGASATTSLSGVRVHVLNRGYYVARFTNVSLVGYPITDSYQIGPLPVAVPTSFVAPPNLDFVSADNSAKIGFVRRVKEVNRSFQGGQFLGELAESVRMVKRPLASLRGGIADYASALKKKRPMIRRSPPNRRESVARKILSDTWLEYSFGWAPLLSDVEDGIKAIQVYAKDENRPYLKRVSCEGISTVNTSEKVSGICNTPGIGLEALRTDVFTYKIRYYGAVKTFNPASQPFRHWGVTLDTFVPTAWELLPWSFFADYFANVGDIIDCACFMRSSLAWCNVSSLRSHLRSFSAFVGQPPAGSFTTLSGGKAAYDVREVSRQPFAGSFVPTLEFRLPGTGKKIANIAALSRNFRSLTPYR